MREVSATARYICLQCSVHVPACAGHHAKVIGPSWSNNTSRGGSTGSLSNQASEDTPAASTAKLYDNGSYAQVRAGVQSETQRHGDTACHRDFRLLLRGRPRLLPRPAPRNHVCQTRDLHHRMVCTYQHADGHMSRASPGTSRRKCTFDAGRRSSVCGWRTCCWQLPGVASRSTSWPGTKARQA